MMVIIQSLNIPVNNCNAIKKEKKSFELLLDKSRGDRERICGVVFPVIASNDTLDPHHAADGRGRTDHYR